MPVVNPPWEQAVAPSPRRARRALPRRTRSGLVVPMPAAVAAWTPLSLPNLVAWYDASDAASITQSSGAVSQWNDKSGNTHHLLQGTGARQPTTGVDTINGLNALKFVSANNNFMSVGSVSVSQPLTMLVVVKRASTAAGVNSQIVANNQGQATLFIDGNVWSMFAGSVTDSATNAQNTNPHQLVGVFNGASSQLFLDGSSILTGNPSTGGKTGLTIGSDTGGNAWDGDIAEIVVIASTITSGDRTSWNTYCARWGL